MRELTLKPRETKTLKINIGDESYQLPLMGSMTMKEAKGVETAAGTYAYITKFIPAKIIDTLPVEDYNSIIAVWKEESQKQSGMKVGES